MKRALATTAVAGLCLLGAASPAFAASPSQTDARTFRVARSTVTAEPSAALISDPVGNSENSDGKSQTRDDETTSNGTLNNRPKHQECTSGPGNQTSC